MKVLLTCPPMIGMKQQFQKRFIDNNIELVIPDFVQTMPEGQLVKIIPEFDGWIIGDDPATSRVIKAGAGGKLKAAVKWGIGVDNVDFNACQLNNIKISNTPDMFGEEVADMAFAYVIGLARELFFIEREIRANKWPKNRGISIKGKKAGVVGFGDIGSNLAKRLLCSGMEVVFFDPYITDEKSYDARVTKAAWPDRLGECDFLIFTCSLNENNFKMLNGQTLSLCKKGVRIVNVARGGLIDEDALIESLIDSQVHSAALDVFQDEPLPASSVLRNHPLCIFGSHNGSNTSEAVAKTNDKVIDILFEFLGVNNG